MEVSVLPEWEHTRGALWLAAHRAAGILQANLLPDDILGDVFPQLVLPAMAADMQRCVCQGLCFAP